MATAPKEQKLDKNGKEILEFPKMLYFASGEKCAVNNEKEEAAAIAENGPLKGIVVEAKSKGAWSK